MKIKSFNNELHPGISMHKIPVRAGFPGLVFTIGTLTVFLMGIPALIYFLVLAIVLGIGFAVMLRFIPRGGVHLPSPLRCFWGWRSERRQLPPGTR